MAIRFIVEVAWQVHFVTNMFIQPTGRRAAKTLTRLYHTMLLKAKVENYKELGLNSETAVMFQHLQAVTGYRKYMVQRIKNEKRYVLHDELTTFH